MPKFRTSVPAASAQVAPYIQTPKLTCLNLEVISPKCMHLSGEQFMCHCPGYITKYMLWPFF